MREKAYSINSKPDEKSSVANDFDVDIREGFEPLQRNSVTNFVEESF